MDNITPSGTPLAASDALNMSRSALTAAQNHLETLQMAAASLAAPGGPIDPEGKSGRERACGAKTA